MQQLLRTACSFAGFLAALVASPGFAQEELPAAQRVVVLVFDGVAASALEGVETPAFDRIEREGAFTHHVEPPFPSLSLPGGFSLSTGCWPAKHGVLSNKFMDGERGFYDHSGDADWLTGCKGLHEVAEAAFVKTATLRWYGAESTTRGPLATTVTGHDAWAAMENDPARAEWVAEQLARQDADAPRLVLAYFQGPDNAEHYQGIGSDEARRAVRDMDAAVARVMRAISDDPLERRTALFVTTDHGMVELDILVNAERLMHWHEIPAKAVSAGTTSFLYFDDGVGEEAIAAAARSLARYPTAYEVLRPEALPGAAHFATTRKPDLILSAKPPYFIEDRDMFPPGLGWLGRWGPRFAKAGLFVKASHGYPPDAVPEMHGVLYAWGAGVAEGFEFEGMRAIDLHPTVTHWLGIAPGGDVDGEVAKGIAAPLW